MKVKYDHYTLYPLLSNGEEALVEHEGVTYKFQFQGNKIGSESFLLVTHPAGEIKKFGWGWDGEQVMRALDHLEKGWDSEQRPPFRLYNRGLPS